MFSSMDAYRLTTACLGHGLCNIRCSERYTDISRNKNEQESRWMIVAKRNKRNHKRKEKERMMG